MVLQDAPDIFPGLRVRGDSSVFLHRFNSRIVAGQSQLKVALKAVEKETKMAHPAVDIFVGVIDIADIMQPRRVRHKLHQSLGPFMGTGLCIEIRFRLNDRPD